MGPIIKKPGGCNRRLTHFPARFLACNRKTPYDSAIKSQEEPQMIFADKLIALRKKAGWSQEELAQQLNVSRQSVSKWEGAQSVPDLDKIVQLSRIFGVSTDYLLKDELEAQETAEPEPEQPARRRVSLEEASRYLELRKQAAPWLALATFLCVLSPITLILLTGLSEYTARISENVAGGIGLCVLILLVAAAVGIFLMCGAKAKPFSFLETEPFETEYGVSGMVRQRRQEFEPTANRLNLIGTILCIVSVLPLFAAMCLSRSDLTYIVAVCLLLGFVALACLAFVYAGTRTGAMEKLLEEGDYTRQRKAKSRLVSTVSVCYWLVVTAVFLLYTFGPLGNGQARYSWFIWAIAGVLYAAVLAVLRLIGNNK